MKSHLILTSLFVCSAVFGAPPCSGLFQDSEQIVNKALLDTNLMSNMATATRHVRDGRKIAITEEAIVDKDGKETGTRYKLNLVGYLALPTTGEPSPLFYRKAVVELISQDNEKAELRCLVNANTRVKRMQITKEEYEKFPSK